MPTEPFTQPLKARSDAAFHKKSPFLFVFQCILSTRWGEQPCEEHGFGRTKAQCSPKPPDRRRKPSAQACPPRLTSPVSWFLEVFGPLMSNVRRLIHSYTGARGFSMCPGGHARMYTHLQLLKSQSPWSSQKKQAHLSNSTILCFSFRSENEKEMAIQDSAVK